MNLAICFEIPLHVIYKIGLLVQCIYFSNFKLKEIQMHRSVRLNWVSPSTLLNWLQNTNLIDRKYNVTQSV